MKKDDGVCLSRVIFVPVPLTPFLPFLSGSLALPLPRTKHAKKHQLEVLQVKGVNT